MRTGQRMTAWADIDSIWVLLQGFFLCASLKLVIGPRTLFILQQGIRRQYLLATALLSALADLVLITIGVGGIGQVIAAHSFLLPVLTTLGALFLCGYGLRVLWLAWRCWATKTGNRVEVEGMKARNVGFRATALAVLGFCFLNPACYTDILLLIGTSGSGYPVDQRWLFGLGAAMASLLWFVSLTYGASRLAFIFQRPLSWRILNVTGSVIMFGMAGMLAANLL
jgi:L-lysine exporter family protein LysE/ArgO